MIYTILLRFIFQNIKSTFTKPQVNWESETGVWGCWGAKTPKILDLVCAHWRLMWAWNAPYSCSSCICFYCRDFAAFNKTVTAWRRLVKYLDVEEIHIRDEFLKIIKETNHTSYVSVNLPGKNRLYRNLDPICAHFLSYVIFEQSGRPENYTKTLINNVTWNYVSVQQKVNVSWDYMLFSQQWPITTCIEHEEKKHKIGVCNLYKNMTGWTVHGLWWALRCYVFFT